VQSGKWRVPSAGWKVRNAEFCTLNSTLYTQRAFTLIEIMVVCAIIGIVMTIAIPSIYRQLHPESMQKAVSDVLEACSHARAHAVLNDTPVELVIRPKDKQIEVAQGSTAPAEPDRLESLDVSGQEWRMPERDAKPAGGGSSIFSAKLSDRIEIEGIRLNFLDFTEDEVVRVRFYPNGTSDEFSLFLVHSETGERRQIALEVVTAIADVESNPLKFR
jgi:prepilin-type N-terminal cleavage/methylation domain-containing protein